MNFKNSWISKLEPISILLLTFFIYLLTIYPDLSPGDGAEFSLSASLFAVPHPPGYPLYLLISHLFTLLPTSPAFATNILSSLFMSLSALLFFRLIREKLTLVSATSLTLITFFATIIWSGAIMTEVFPLQNFLFLLLISLLIKPITKKTKYLIPLIAGLLLSHHHQSVLFIPPFFYLFYKEIRNETVKIKLTTLGIFLVSIIFPYIILFISYFLGKLHSWGEINSLTGFLNHLLRRDYGTFALTKNQEYSLFLVFSNLFTFFKVVLISSLGTLLLLQKETWKLFVLVLLPVLIFTILGAQPLTNSISITVIERFWQLPFIFLMLLLGLNFHHIRNLKLQKVSYIILPLLAIFQIIFNFQSMNHSRDKSLENYGEAYLSSLPLDSLLLTKGDLIYNPIRYLQTVSKLRPDIIVLDQELMTYRWYKKNQQEITKKISYPGECYNPSYHDCFSLKQFVDSNLASRRIFIAGGTKNGDNSLLNSYQKVKVGLLEEILPTFQEVPADHEIMENKTKEALSKIDVQMIQGFSKSAYEQLIRDDYYTFYATTSSLLLIRSNYSPFALEKVRSELLGLYKKESPEKIPYPVHKNLGIAQIRLSDPMAKSSLSYYLENAPKDEVDYSKIKAIYTSLK